MTDPYVSFDTFSLGESAAEPAPAPAPPRPSLLAKLPRVAPTPSRPKPIQRFDDAESPLHGVHVSELGGDLAMAGPSTSAGPLARRPMPANPAATIRIDTVSPTTFDDEQPLARRPASAPAAAKQPAIEVVVDDPWAAWILNLESVIVPYSRVIVLAAVIAAMGLTVVLLRGGAKTAETPSAAPQVSTDGAGDSLVANDFFATPSATSSNTWPTPAAATPDAELRPISPPAVASAAVTTPFASAAGPASAWRGPAGAKLSGEVLPVDDSRVNVAEVPAFPPTKTR